jgi:translation initiation factor 1A
MPNQKGGKKFKKGKKNNNFEKKLIFKDPKEDQEYAKVLKVNGSGRYNLLCFDGSERLGICAGNIKRKVRLSLNDIVLVSLWDFQDSKCSIIHKYEIDEILKLKNENEFPSTIQLEEKNDYSEDIDGISFTYDNPSDEEEKKTESSSGSDNEINLDDI